MKKFILMLVFVLGTFTFSEITTSEVESFFTPKAQIYVSNQKLIDKGWSKESRLLQDSKSHRNIAGIFPHKIVP